MNYCGRCRQKYDNHGQGHAANCPLGSKYKTLLQDAATRIKAEPKSEEPELVFIRYSKFSGHCRTKDCRNRWDEGEAMYWNPKTREVFCEDCGDEINGAASA